MAGKNQRSRRAPPGGTLLPTTRRAAPVAPGSAAGSIGRGQEAQRAEIATSDSIDRSHSGGSLARAHPDTASIPQQATTVGLQRSGVGNTQQRGILHGAWPSQAVVRRSLRRSGSRVSIHKRVRRSVCSEHRESLDKPYAPSDNQKKL